MRRAIAVRFATPVATAAHRGDCASRVCVLPGSTQFNAKSAHFDAESKTARVALAVGYVQQLRKTRKLTPPELAAGAAPDHPVPLRQGNRLSITPVEPELWWLIVKLLRAAAG